MEYSFAEIEKKWKKIWEEKGIYKVTEDPSKPKYYVLDMFPYPSGAGLHVGHPLGYVASDIYARYKRLKGFNVLHPMGYDAFGLPAEQYAIETGTRPEVTTEKAIKRYREQLDKIGFSFDWSRQVKTSDPAYYKWTQWMFLKLFGSWYNRATNRAESIETLIDKFTLEQTMFEIDGEDMTWDDLTESDQQRILMQYRLAFLSYAEVNWCPALGTVLANDEVKDGKSERGGYPVERKKMRQWFLRITEYSDRLLEGLEKLDWSESMKEMQRNWIGRSEGALVEFHLSPTLSEGEGAKSPKYHTTDGQTWKHNLELAKEHRNDPTEAESIIWEYLRAKRTGYKFRRQHPIDRYIPDFVCLEKGLIVEIDGKIHLQQVEQDKERTEVLKRHGFEVLRFTNEEVIAKVDEVIEKIKAKLALKTERKVLPFGEDLGGVVLEIFTTRPDTIFGATFMVIAPEHELVEQLTTAEKKQEVEAYITYVKSRTDVERQQEKRVTGVFTGSYVVNPFTGNDIPIWIAEYVLAGYGTGAIMAVPADDERDRKFAEKFGLPIVDIIDKSMHPGATIEDKVGKMINSDFLNGLEVKDAIKKILEEIEALGIGEKKINYRQRDAGFSRQRYWGEPFPIVLTPDTSPKERGELRRGYMTGSIETAKNIIYAKEHRKNPTEAEEKLWQALRNEKIGAKFRRQHLIDKYIVDFVCLKKELVVEVDGDIHEFTTEEDEARTGLLNEYGFKVIRFTNDEVLKNTEEVLKKIKAELDTRQDITQTRERNASPSPWERGPGGEDLGAENIIVTPLPENELPLVLPEVSSYKPSGDGSSPLANNKEWVAKHYETDTMPGYAGSSWYFLRYMDAHNDKEFAAKDKIDYWQNVDVYFGGAEHAVGHLLYSRMWHKFLYDLGYVNTDEPFKKLVNQGMIQGQSKMISVIFVGNVGYIVPPQTQLNGAFSASTIEGQNLTNINFPIEYTISDGDKYYVTKESLQKAKVHYPKFENYHIGTLEDLGNESDVEPIIDEEQSEMYFQQDKVEVSFVVEKMSKSKYNVINPDDVIDKYGADCFRMFEMFLGPIEQSKPWDDKGISGVSNFFRKFWRLFYDDKGWKVTDEKASDAELKILHKTLKKIAEDIERLNFNTSVSAFMIATNELTTLSCHKKEILEPLLIALAPFAPFITEELWEKLGNKESIHKASYPTIEEKYLVEDSHTYPVSINGKVRAQVNLSLSLSAEDIEKEILQMEKIKQFTNGNPPKKFIFVKGKIINVVV